MAKKITDSQILGELGETNIKRIVLEAGFIYEPRGRLEAGTDGIVELRDPVSGAPLGKLLGVQVKATAASAYQRETEAKFEYLLKAADLAYWRQSNVPVIIVLWRKSDNTAYWKNVTDAVRADDRRLHFDKVDDVFDTACADRLGSLTVDRQTPGVFIPPLSKGEEVITNLLRVKLPEEIFIASSPFGTGRDAVPDLLKQNNNRFDWVIRKRRFVSFFDPRDYGTRAIVDDDQVEAIDTALFAFNDDLDDFNDMVELLRRTVERQVRAQLSYLVKDRLFYFHASAPNKARSYRYTANVKETSAKVVSVYQSTRPDGKGYVRHHAAAFRFERLADEWFIVVEPTFYFTTDGYKAHRFAEALLAGKKRLERNAAVRGQVIMWQHVLTESAADVIGLFDSPDRRSPTLGFEHLQPIELSRAVPESSWNRVDPRAKDMVAPDLFEDGPLT